MALSGLQKGKNTIDAPADRGYNIAYPLPVGGICVYSYLQCLTHPIQDMICATL